MKATANLTPINVEVLAGCVCVYFESDIVLSFHKNVIDEIANLPLEREEDANYVLLHEEDGLLYWPRLNFFLSIEAVLNGAFNGEEPEA